MNLPVILSLVADREFVEAAAWHEQQTGRGEAFIEHVQKALDRLNRMPELHAMVVVAQGRALREADRPRDDDGS